MKNVNMLVWMGFLFCGNSLGAMDPTSPRLRRDSNHAIAPEEQRRMDASAVESPLAAKIRQEVEFLELKVLLHKQFFCGDKERTKRAFRALLALPATDCKPTDREIDKELIHALASGNEVATKQLLERGANPNCYAPAGATMLLVALTFEDPAVKYQLVAALLEHGADPNLPSSRCWTPLHAAVQQLQFELNNDPGKKGLVDTVKLLIQKGARLKLSLLDLRDQDSLRSPLSYIEPYCAYNSDLISLLMTTVHSDDRLLGSYEEEIAFEVLARNKLLLCMAPLSMSLQDTASSDACTRFRKMLDVELHDSQYGAQVLRNARLMLAQAKESK